MFTVETENPNQTEQLAGIIASYLSKGSILALDGDLGAGKTIFSKGLAKSLGVKEPVTSPTFVIMQQYEDGRIPLYHFDVYRIEDPDELYETGAEEFFYGDGISVIELASLIEELLPEDMIRVRISRMPEKGPDRRKIDVDGFAPETERKIKEELDY